METLPFDIISLCWHSNSSFLRKQESTKDRPELQYHHTLRTSLFQKRALVLKAISLLSIVGAVALFFSTGRTSDAETSYWPPLTMVYEIDGQVWNGQVIRETHRLEYRSASDWTDTVIDSTSIQSRALGTITAAGTYMRRDGNQLETYDSITGDTDIYVSENNVIPNAFLAPFHIFENVENSEIGPVQTTDENSSGQGSGGAGPGEIEGGDDEVGPVQTTNELELVETTTTATVCYQSACEDNVGGLAFDMNGSEWVVVDDEKWGIALRVGDKFVVKELRLHVAEN